MAIQNGAAVNIARAWMVLLGCEVCKFGFRVWGFLVEGFGQSSEGHIQALLTELGFGDDLALYRYSNWA